MVAFQTVLAFLLLAIVVLALIQVFFRYVIERNAKGVEELARLAVVWLSFLGGGYACIREKLITVDFLRAKLKNPKALKALDLFVLACMSVVGFMMMYHGMKYVVRYWTFPDLSTSLLFPRSLFFLPIPVSGTMILVKCICSIVGTLRRRDA